MELFATSKKMKNMKINLGINSSQITKAKDLARAIAKLNTSASQLKKIHIGSIGIRTSDVSKVRTLAAAMQALHKSGQANTNLSKLAVPQVNMGAIARIRTATQALTNYLAVLRAIQRMGNIRTPNMGGGGAGAGGGGGAGAGGAGNRGGGNGIFGRVNQGMLGSFVAFSALSTAANLAAAALRGVAEAGYRRERGNLALVVGATPAQKEIINAAAQHGPAGQTIVLSVSERREFMRSLLGDVQGDERGAAVGAANISAAVEPLVQRLFAISPGRDKEDIIENLRQVVKAANLGSQQLTDTQGQLTQDAGRVLTAISDAMAIDPEITPQLVNTTMRGLKTSAFSMSQEQLTRVLLNAGSRGVRAGNEALQAIRGLEGNQKKEANANLARIGVFKNGEAVQGNLLEENTSEWIRTILAPAIRKDMGMAPAAPGEELMGFKPAELTRELINLLGRETSRQGVADLILGDAQMNNSLAQIARLAAQTPDADVAGNWAAQLDRAGTNLEDAAARQMEAAMALIDAAGFLKMFNAGIEGKSRPWTLGDLFGIKPDPNAPKTRPWTLGDLLNLINPTGAAHAAGGTAAGPAEAASIQVKQARREVDAAKALVAQRNKELTGLRRQEALGGQYAPRAAVGTGMFATDAVNNLTQANEQLAAAEKKLAAARSVGAVKALALIAAGSVGTDRVKDWDRIEPRWKPSMDALVKAESERTRASRAELLSFQRAHGLKETGWKDRATRAASRKDFKDMAAILGGEDNVKALQAKLGVKIDGLYGPISQFAVKVRKILDSVPIDTRTGKQALTTPTIAPSVIDPIVKRLATVTIPATMPQVLTVRAVQVLTTRPATTEGMQTFGAGGPQPQGFTPVAGDLMANITMLTTASNDMAAVFDSGSSKVEAAGVAAGAAVAASVDTAGSAINAAFSSGGASAAAQIRAALATGVNVNVRGAGADTGPVGGSIGGPH